MKKINKILFMSLSLLLASCGSKLEDNSIENSETSDIIDSSSSEIIDSSTTQENKAFQEFWDF